MATAAPVPGSGQHPRASNLDVDWLLHGKREFASPPAKEKEQGNLAKVQRDARPTTPPQAVATTPSKQVLAQTSPIPQGSQASRDVPQHPQPVHTHGNGAAPSSPVPTAGQQAHSPRTPPEDSKKGGKSKRDSKRSSWFSSLGNKISGGSSTSSRVSNTDSQSPKATAQSPKLEFQNPFDKNATVSGQQSQQQKPDASAHYTPQAPRRPSVLVAAGTETKLDSSGFITNALRRLSSGTAVSLGRGGGSANNITPRRVLNVDLNRERTKIPEFEQNKLRRVAFCVDVEIAGIASQADEETVGSQSVGNPATSTAAKSNDGPAAKRSSALAKSRDQAEAAVLKNTENEAAAKPELGETQEDAEVEKRQRQQTNASQGLNASQHTEEANAEAEPDLDTASVKPTTRKKEKKKRSEAERKERRERKRRHAEMNGLVPLEITRDDDDSDSSSTNTPAGSSTPQSGDHPTTNPLRIYKRCCQLRETTALSLVKDQISKPAATLAEAPGTVPVIDLSGSKMSLQDITTFGDWLAVVPVRKLILDDCALGDDAIRILLSGLLGCKTPEQARQNRRLPKLGSSKPGREQLSVIERLSLKNNSAITSKGWKYIALFIHLSRSLCAIDLTGIPYPVSTGSLMRTNTNTNSTTAFGGTDGPLQTPMEIGSLIARAIRERFGTKLEELILSGCSLTAFDVSELIDAAIHCRIRRLGLAGNHLNNEAMGHVVRYAASNVCEGLDLGSNNLHDNEHLLSQVIHDQNPMFALSLADCHLTPSDLQRILPRLCEMKNLKFIDLSRNHGLFHGVSNAIPILRKRMPKMRSLKRIHLVDVGLKPDDVIALADVFPHCPSLAHINILENEPLVKAMNSSHTENQEEAAAFLSSLMTATRVSNTLVAVELEVPSSESSEVVKALSQQVVAYSLRNMERSALSDFGVESKAMPDKDTPEVLLHLVGNMEGYPETVDTDDPAPDEDYLIASSGIVKALNVCLVNRSASRTMTPTASGAVTPRQGPMSAIPSPMPRKRPMDVSLELCEAARKIRLRLQAALVKEDKAGNHDTYRRLAILDQTLEGIIHRFEEEYPDARSASDIPSLDLTSSASETPNLSRISSVQDPSMLNISADYTTGHEPSTLLKNSPSSSSTSLASKALSLEEGRMHKFGQSMRRGLLKPVGTDDFQHGTSINDQPEPVHVAALRHKLNDISGEEIRERVERQGADEVVRELEISAAELRCMANEDPVGFEALRNSSLMSEVNGTGTQTSAPVSNGIQSRAAGSFHTEVTS